MMMAQKKAAGNTKNGRDSQSKRLGVKVFGGQAIHPGCIIIRQRGTKFNPGTGVKIGKDHTIYSLHSGTVQFYRKQNKQMVGVIPNTTVH